MPSAGEQRPALQKWRPPYRSLVTANVESEAPDTAVVPFRVLVPDSRLRVKISLLFSFQAGQRPEDTSTIDLSSGGATLWLYESDDDDSGMTGDAYGCTNIEGTAAAPTAIPRAVGLSGYSREFITAGDNIEGIFTTGFNGFLGNWNLQLRYQPDNGQRFTDEEWRYITANAKAICPGRPFNITGG